MEILPQLPNLANQNPHGEGPQISSALLKSYRHSSRLCGSLSAWQAAAATAQDRNVNIALRVVGAQVRLLHWHSTQYFGHINPSIHDVTLPLSFGI